MATEKEKSDNYLKAKEELKGLFECIQNESLPQIQQKIQDLIASSKGEDKLTLASIVEDYREGNGRSLLHFAASRGDVEIFKYLTSEECDLNAQDKEGNTPLFVAVQHDNMPMIQYLIEEKKCNITQSRTGGTTILHLACSTGNAFLVQYLIEKGANVDATSEVGTPLQWAISSQKKDIVKILLHNKANPNRISPEQAFMPPPLILAIDTRDNELFDLLLEHGADVNSKDRDGWNPLQFAAEIGDLRLCKVLLEKGVDPNYECKGQTALELAFTNNQMETVSLLRPLTKKSLDGKVVKQNKEQNSASAEEGPLNPQEAERLKGEGNKLFAENKVEEALQKYEEALSHGRQAKEAAPIYSNIALCLMKQKKLQEALLAAQEAKRVDPSWVKGYLREAQIYEALNEYGEAAATYFEALKLDPTNSDLKHNFDTALDKGKMQYAKKNAGK